MAAKRLSRKRRVNAVQLSLFDALIAVDEAISTLVEPYRGRPMPRPIALMVTKLVDRRERLRSVNARLARLGVAA